MSPHKILPLSLSAFLIDQKWNIKMKAIPTCSLGHANAQATLPLHLSGGLMGVHEPQEAEELLPFHTSKDDT